MNRNNKQFSFSFKNYLHKEFLFIFDHFIIIKIFKYSCGIIVNIL